MTSGGSGDQLSQPWPGQPQPDQPQYGPPPGPPHSGPPQYGPPPHFGPPPGPPQSGRPPQYGPPQYGPPQYGPPGPYGPQFLQGRRTNTLAIIALCCGIGQVIAGPFAGIPAVILGIMSLGQVRQTGEDGHGMAVAGIILGIVGLILDVILIIFFIAVWHHVTTQFPSPGNSPSFP